MKQIMKRGVSFLLVLVLMAAMMPGLSIAADAVTADWYEHGFELTVSGGACATCNQGARVTSVAIEKVEMNGDIVKLTYFYGREEHGNCWPYTDYITIELDNFSCTTDYYKKVQDGGKYEPRISVRRSGGHTVSEWTSSNGIHTGNCNVCNETVTGTCSGTLPNCKEPGICSTCEKAYLPVNPDGHVLYEGEMGNGTHAYTCGLCFETFTETCSTRDGYGVGAFATCISKARCDTCGREYGEVDPQVHDYRWTSNGDQHWQVCSRSAEHITEKTDCTLDYSYAKPSNRTIRVIESCVGTPSCGHFSMAYVELDPTKHHTYTGSPITPANISTNGTWIDETKYQPAYSNNINAGDAKLTLHSYEWTFKIVPYDISGEKITVEFAPASGTYNGQKQEPACIVKFGGSPLTAGTDYDLAWNGDLTNTGQHTLTITGKGNFTGTRTVSYEICKALPRVTAPKTKELAYNGGEQPLVEPGSTNRGTMAYSLNETGPYTLDIPTGKKVGSYRVWYQVDVGADPNYQNLPPVSVEVTIGKAQLIPVITGTASKVYDGNTDVTDAQSLTVTADGIAKGENVTFTAHYIYEDANAGENKTICASNISLLGADADNYQLAADSVSAPVGRIEPQPLTEDAAVTAAPMVWDGTEQTAELTSFWQNGFDVTYELSGNSATAVGAYTMTATGTGNFQGDLELEFYILPNEEILDGITESNVASDQKETVRKAKEMAETADTTGFPQEQKTAMDALLKEILEKAEELEKRLKDARNATATEAVVTGTGITGENAKASDKKTLMEAKKDLEAALNTYGSNYTAEEKKILNDEINRLEDILADIAAAEDVIEGVEALPESVAPDESDVWKLVDELQAAYDALNEGQKKIVDNSTDGKITKLQAARYDVRLTKISARTWYKKGTKNLVLTFNGPRENFSHLMFGADRVPDKYISVKSGSTVITLNPSFLTEEEIPSGKTYKVTAVYNFGKDEAGRDILVESSTDAKGKATEVTVKTLSANAATGDLFQVGLWAGIGGISLAALILLLILMKKKEKK